jgi:hypothetical protein
MKMSALAPIEVEILLGRGSPQKIRTDCFASSLFQARVREIAPKKIINQIPFFKI